MTDQRHLEIQGTLIAVRSVLSYLLAKACVDDEGSLEQLHALIAGHIEGGIGKVRSDNPDVSPVADALETNAIEALDSIFLASRGLLKRME